MGDALIWSISAPGPATMPATVSLWPPRYFEAEWTQDRRRGERLLEERRRPGIVDGGDGALRSRGARVGQCPEARRPSRSGSRDRGVARPATPPHRIGIGAIDIVDLDPRRGKKPFGTAVSIAVAVADRDDALAGSREAARPR